MNGFEASASTIWNALDGTGNRNSHLKVTPWPLSANLRVALPTRRLPWILNACVILYIFIWYIYDIYKLIDGNIAFVALYINPHWEGNINQLKQNAVS